MNETTIPTRRYRASCQDCGHRYRVARSDRTYACPECGGTVAVPTEPLPADTEAATPPTRTQGLPAETIHEEEHVEARREATRALRSGYRRIAALRWISRAGAVGYALVTIIAIVALSEPDIPLVPGLLVVGLSAGMTVLLLVGAIQVLFRPLTWTLVVAIGATGVAAVHAVGPNPLGVALWWSALWALLHWAAVPTTLRFGRLIDAHTDLYILQQSSQRTRRRLDAGSPLTRHDRLLRVMKQASHRAWRLSALASVGVLVLAATGAWLVKEHFRPPDWQRARTAFESAWTESDLDALAESFVPRIATWQTERLRGLAEGYGWGEELPTLETLELDRRDTAATATYDAAGVEVVAQWLLDEDAWQVASLTIPPHPLEPKLEAFEAAWRRSDLEALAALFDDEYQEAMLGSIRRSAERRSWDPLPEILGKEVRAFDEESAELRLQVELGTVGARFEFWPDGRWGLQNLEFPKPRPKRRPRPPADPTPGNGE